MTKLKNILRKPLPSKYKLVTKREKPVRYGNLGSVFQSLGQYDKAKEYLEKALAIKIQIGDKEGEASSYGNLGSVFQSLGQYDKAERISSRKPL